MNTLTETLPTFQRRTATFDDTFGVDASDVLAAIQAADDDPVSQAPRLAIALPEVGYKRSRLPIELADPFAPGAGRTVRCVADVRVATSVPATRRGVHVSRIGDALARSVVQPYPDLSEYARTLAHAIARSQYGGVTVVRIRGRIPYLEQVTTGANGKTSLEHLTMVATVRLDADGAATTGAGIRVAHLVACPCVQRVYRHTRIVSGMAADAIDLAGPGFTHTQRCVTTVCARGLKAPLPVPEVLHRLDAVLVRTMNTLPRGEELMLVHRAHRSPQFIEDSLRQALWAMSEAIGTAGFGSIAAKARSLESIHDFDLCASATLTADEARRMQRAPSL